MTNEKRAFRAWPASCATRFIEDLRAVAWLLIDAVPECGPSV